MKLYVIYVYYLDFENDVELKLEYKQQKLYVEKK